MIPRDLTSIRAKDVEQLLQDNQPESITLEYKQALDPNQRISLLKTVCAFANTGAGDIVFGMEEENHYPRALPGIAEAHVEQTKLWIEQWVRTGIEPPSVTVRPWPVDLGNGRWAVVVRVERSWAGPHRVKEDGRFHRRHSAGHCEMTIEELRRVFTEAELLAVGVRRFREERVDRIRSRSAVPAQLAPGPGVILHLIPLAAVRGGSQIDVHDAYERLNGVTALRSHITSRRYNLDGVVGVPDASDGKFDGYCQVFRTGALEAAACLLTKPPAEGATDYAGAVASPEYRVLTALGGYISLLEQLGVPWPVYGLLSMYGLHNYKLIEPSELPSRYYSIGDPCVIDLLKPDEVDLPGSPTDSVQALWPIFDVIWQTFGRARSPYAYVDGELKLGDR